MKANILLFFFASTSLLVHCTAQVQTELPYTRELQNVLDSTRQAAGVRGVSVAVVIPGHRPWLGTSGESHPGRPITPDMLFDMGSAGKLILAALVLDLCEDGLLSLEDSVGKYLAPFPNVDGAITIRQLLNHTNGLYDMVPHPGGPFRVPYDSIDFTKWWTIDEIFTTLGGKPYFAPGKGFHYTQAGFQLASLVVERVTHSTVPEQIQERLLSPLGLDGMLLDHSKPTPARFEIAHHWVDTDSDGMPEDVSPRSRNWIASLSRIDFYTRAGDFALLAHALFGGKVLQSSSLKEMLTFVHPKAEETDGPLFVDYGLGIMQINPQLMRGQKTLGHLGSVPGFRAFVGHFPELNATMAVLYNSDTDNGFVIIDGLLSRMLNHLGR